MADKDEKDTDEHSAVDAEVVEASGPEGSAGAVAAGEATEVSFSRSEPDGESSGSDTTAERPVVDAPPETVSETAEPFGEAPSTTPPPAISAPPAFGESTTGTSPAAADRAAAAAGEDDKFAERPELFVAGAFLGAFILAKLLGRLGGDDE